MGQPEENTDTELFRENEGDYYSPSLHKTEHGKIGIDVGGTVYVKSLREWHKLAEQRQETRQHETIVVWTRRHINDTVWVIATDAELEVDRKYQTTPGSEFPTKFFKVHDKWKPDSLNRYLVTEILNEECA